MILDKKEFTTPFEEISPQELNKCQVLFVGIEEKVRPRPSGHCAPNLQSLATVNELKIIIFLRNHLTVLVYPKKIIHLSVGG